MGIPYQCQLAYAWTKLNDQNEHRAVALLVPNVVLGCSRYGESVRARWVWLAERGVTCIVNCTSCLSYVAVGKWRDVRPRDVLSTAAALLRPLALACRYSCESGATR